MKLIDLLEKINENESVYVVGGGKLLSKYDGKNSIDKALNTCKVKEIYLTGNNINVVLEV